MMLFSELLNHRTTLEQQNSNIYCFSTFTAFSTYVLIVSEWFSTPLQPNVGILNLPAAGGSAGGMLDRSRMALCAFTFFFLSLNPLATLLCSGNSRSAEGAVATSAHHAGRSILGVDITGTK